MSLVIKPFSKNKTQFAFNPESVECTVQTFANGVTLYQHFVDFVRFEPQRNGRIAAHMGKLYIDSVHEFVGRTPDLSLEQLLDAFTGPVSKDTLVHWDGSSVFYKRGLEWSNPDMHKSALPVLQKALEGYPEVPESYVGWYRKVGKTEY